MSFEKIMLIISLISFLGILVLVLRKIPLLSGLPETVSGDGLFFKLKNVMKGAPVFRSFSFEIILHKTLSQLRVWSLKADNKTFNLLKNLREKNYKKKLENENYWEEVKNSTKEEK